MIWHDVPRYYAGTTGDTPDDLVQTVDTAGSAWLGVTIEAPVTG